jgi:hypothetical protein
MNQQTCRPDGGVGVQQRLSSCVQQPLSSACGAALWSSSLMELLRHGVVAFPVRKRWLRWRWRCARCTMMRSPEELLHDRRGASRLPHHQGWVVSALNNRRSFEAALHEASGEPHVGGIPNEWATQRRGRNGYPASSRVQPHWCTRRDGAVAVAPVQHPRRGSIPTVVCNASDALKGSWCRLEGVKRQICTY